VYPKWQPLYPSALATSLAGAHGKLVVSAVVTSFLPIALFP
jgi:hypothetical protein